MERLYTQLDDCEDVNIVEHYDLYYQMFLVLHPTQHPTPVIYPSMELWKRYQHERQTLGYRPAYRELYQTLCVVTEDASSSSD